jgi:hypothetical protein
MEMTEAHTLARAGYIYKDNDLKISKGLELYGDKYKVITEKEVPYIDKTKIFELIETGIVVVNEKSLSILKKYKH